MDFHLRIKTDYKLSMYKNVCFSLEKVKFFLKKQLQIENAGFVKTCDEHVLHCFRHSAQESH
jgi:hypothetical protein